MGYITLLDMYDITDSVGRLRSWSRVHTGPNERLLKYVVLYSKTNPVINLVDMAINLN